MLEYYREHWYFALILILALGLAIFALYKASKASSRSRAQREAFLQQAAYDNVVRLAFAEMDATAAQDADAQRLFDGAANHLQRALEQTPSMNAAFLALPPPAQRIYALHYVLQAAAGSLSKFFTDFGPPLTPAALEAAQLLLPPEAAAIFTQVYAAYDPEDETQSLIQADVAQQDIAFKDALQKQSALPAIAAYIREHLFTIQAVSDLFSNTNR